MVAIQNKVEVSNLDQSHWWQRHASLVSRGNALPACLGMALQWLKVLVKVVGTAPAASDPGNANRLYTGIATVMYLQAGLDISQPPQTSRAPCQPGQNLASLSLGKGTAVQRLASLGLALYAPGRRTRVKNGRSMHIHHVTFLVPKFLVQSWLKDTGGQSGREGSVDPS
jgi:hypothetical protein